MEPPVRILAVVPEPIESAWSAAAAAAWTAIDMALQAHIRAGRLEVVRLKPATAYALEEALQREPFDVVHVIARGTSRPAARHGTVTLEASDRRARDLNAHNFAKLCASAPDLALVILQPVGGAPTDLDVLRDTVFQQARSVVCAPLVSGVSDSHEATRFAQAFYAGLAAGKSLNEAFAMASRNPTTLSAGAASRDGEARLLVPERPTPAAARGVGARKEPLAPSAPTVTQSGESGSSSRLIEHKRALCAFDVFLCHCVCDKPAVIGIGRQLMARGVLPWLDQWELRPGAPWQRVLEQQIVNIQAAAVFVGQEGIGPWQRLELEAFLREFNKRGCPVIPVMLPGARGEPELPLFLGGMTWVDFRVADPDPLEQLIWGITGQRP
jgi:TIR domain/CHAT domain